MSDAEVAEAEYTAFTSKKGRAITARLIVRRVKDLNRQAGQGQDELLPVWRYHAIFTDSPFETTIQAEEQHRDYLLTEQRAEFPQFTGHEAGLVVTGRGHARTGGSGA